MFRGEVINKNDEDYDPVPTSYFLCDLIGHDYDYDYEEGLGAAVTDGSGYFAALCVEEDFGCNRWEHEQDD
jgi:hypothetical protein